LEEELRELLRDRLRGGLGVLLDGLRVRREGGDTHAHRRDFRYPARCGASLRRPAVGDLQIPWRMLFEWKDSIG
jgi:hypothetical protein